MLNVVNFAALTIITSVSVTSSSQLSSAFLQLKFQFLNLGFVFSLFLLEKGLRRLDFLSYLLIRTFDLLISLKEVFLYNL